MRNFDDNGRWLTKEPTCYSLKIEIPESMQCAPQHVKDEYVRLVSNHIRQYLHEAMEQTLKEY